MNNADDTLREAASRLHEEGQYAESIALWRQYIEHHPDGPSAYSNLGNVLTDAGLFAEAEESYKAALGIDPDDGDYHFNYANLLMETDEEKRAQPEYERAIELNPADVNAHFNLANCLRDQFMNEEAAHRYRTVLERTPLDPEAHNNLGLCLKNMGGADGAQAEYEEAIRLDPQMFSAHYNLAKLFEARRDWARAGVLYRAATQLEASGIDLSDAYRFLAEALQAQGNLPEAVREYQASLRLNDESYETHINYGVTLHELGRLDEAIEEYKKGVALNDSRLFWQDRVIGLNNIADALMDKGEAEASQVYRERAKAAGEV